MNGKPVLAAMNFVFARYSLDYALAAIAAAGFRRLELWGGHPHAAAAYMETSYRREVEDLLRRHHLTLTMYTPEQIAYPFSIASENRWIREVSVGYFRQAVAITAALRVPRMLMTAGTCPLDADPDRALEYCLESLQEICRCAADRDVRIVLEPLAREESPLINSLPTLRQAFDRLRQYGTEVIADLAPLCLNGETLDDYFSAFGERLSVIHCIDCDGRGVRHLVPGEGVIDFPAVARTIRRNRFSGTLSLELGAAYQAAPAEALVRAKDYLLDLFGDNVTL